MAESTQLCAVCGAANLPARGYCRLCGASLGAGEPTWADGVAPPRRAERPFGGEDTWRVAPDAVDPALLTVAERRAATVVKADLSGFTAMSERLGDPEEVTIIMNQVFEPLVDLVRRHEGYVDNYAGDMVICFWGAPDAVEGGPERAVRAALGMRAAVAEVNARGISHGVELGISTGVATGEGLWGPVGTGTNRRWTLSGLLGDYAALIEKYTERGHVGICPETARALPPGLVLTPLDEHLVTPPGGTGSEPMVDAELPAAEPDWLTAARAGAGAVHGAEAPRAALAAAWAEARASGGRVWRHLHGEPGAGKTRLALEVAEQAVAEGAALVAVGVGPCARAEGWTLDLPAVPDGPAVVVVDGLDWVDAWPREALRALPGDRPLLILTISRAAAPVADLEAEPIFVGPLSAAATGAVAADEIGRAVSATEADWLMHWIGGNPRLARLLAVRLPVAAVDDESVLAECLTAPPAGLRAFAAAALDRLTPESRAVAYAAAELTEPATLRFDPAEVARRLAEPEWSWHLEQLERADLVDRVGDPPQLVWRHRCYWALGRERVVDSARAVLVGE